MDNLGLIERLLSGKADILPGQEAANRPTAAAPYYWAIISATEPEVATPAPTILGRFMCRGIE